MKPQYTVKTVIRKGEQYTKLSQLKNLFRFRDEGTVLEFLQEHTYLIDLLIEAYWHIETYFGYMPQVFLELVVDPEANGDRQLVAYIRNTFTADEALNKLQHLDEDWWLDAMNRSKGNLCITLDFDEF